jgi:hypothetical protein
VLEHRIIHWEMLLVHASFEADKELKFLVNSLEQPLDLPPLQARAIHRQPSG